MLVIERKPNTRIVFIEISALIFVLRQLEISQAFVRLLSFFFHFANFVGKTMFFLHIINCHKNQTNDHFDVIRNFFEENYLFSQIDFDISW